MKIENRQRFYGMLGFAMRAGKVVIGTENVCRALQKGGKDRPLLVLISEKASDPTKKKIRNKTEFYQTTMREVDMDMEELGRLLGKLFDPAVIAVTDGRFADEIQKCLAPSES